MPELFILLAETSGLKREFELHFRAYDDGVAFRHGFPKQPNLNEFVIAEELRRFEFPSDDTVWASIWNMPHNSNEVEFSITRISEIKSKSGGKPTDLERTEITVTGGADHEITIDTARVGGAALMFSPGR